MDNNGLYNQKANIYVIITSLLGISWFVILGDITFTYSANLWFMIASLVLVLVLCRHFTILLPPRGNALSMDSAIYLACIFVFGLEFSLTILFISSIIGSLYLVRTAWWKHIFNFAVFSIMIVGAHYVFTVTGGQVGVISPEFILQYILTLAIYMFLNIFCIGMFFYLIDADSLISMIRGLVKESISSYISILILSLLLGILLLHQPFYGLFLFSCLILVLSFAFKQHFQLYEEASKKANVDHLTGLYNHGYFKEQLEEMIKAKNVSQICLAMIDIDDFKKYNDYFGHLQGDELLKCFGSLLKDGCSEANYTLARYGGEEFVILMPETSQRDAFHFLDGLRKKINDTYFKGVEILPHGCLSFSGGIIHQDGEVYSSSELLGQADQALYYAKAQGKNNIHLYDEKDIVQKNLDEEKEIELLEQQVRIFLSKDIYTYKHSKRVFKYAVKFAKKLGLNEYEKKTLIMGALIHDIGKLEIPRDVINKKGKLDAHEWDMLKKHVTWGKEIISTNKELLHLVPLVELHHERYDGKGYPHGLKGERIPKLARILCIIDSFDAMTTERPYQATKSFAEAIIELEECAGKQFDPNFVPLFIEMIQEEEMMVKEMELPVTT
ncbi:diguanylate cyclase [Alkalihalobacillus sp. MEB130]|uniref:bifunctional diguanylate cyclase/phosphohydrolase n=1 Tax=Alkalihalobacillus sp. MEB130 TaxID=2976704 RepID=UPI0028DF755C|nr:diguanylate cyclase [Alkalihalobacillus sp. MEB130]MDT8860391.1 diguanylate cyclase [Alkalihalobacillus sp. MEB130]